MATASPTSDVTEPYKLPPEFPVIDGVPYLPGTTRELIDNIHRLPVQEGDVFIASYPKAGTTWCSEIVWQVCNGGQIDKDAIAKRVPFVEAFDLIKLLDHKEDKGFKDTSVDDFYKSVPPPRIFKTHLQYRLVPKGEGLALKPKYIYVIRNPKDTGVSFYYHCRRLTPYKCTSDWSSFYEAYIDGKVDFGSWFDHVLGWWEHRDDPNILILKYEDMKKDLESAVCQIAKFVGKDVSEETIQQISSQTTFEAMKDGHQFHQGEDNAIRVPGQTKFLRKGAVGDWRNHFTDEQNRRYDELYASKMAGSGLELEF